MLRFMFVAACLACLLAVPLFGQSEDAAAISDRSLAAAGAPEGLGDIVFGPVDVENPTGDIRCLGVQFYDNRYFVTGAAAGAGAQMIYEFDAVSGALLNSYPQVATGSPFWGNRDLAGGPAGDIFSGNEAGELHQYNWTGATLNYVMTHVDPTATLGTLRALVQDPNNGEFYTADFSGNVYHFTISSPGILSALNTYTNPGQALYGFAWDDKQTPGNPADDTLWGWSQDSGNPACATDAVLAREYQVVAGTGLVPTGIEFWGATLYGCGPSNIAGGADIYDDPRNPSAGHNSFVGLHQTGPDSIAVYDLNPDANPQLRMPYPGEPRMDNVIVADRVTPGADCVFVAGLAFGSTSAGCGGQLFEIAVIATLGTGKANANGLAAKAFFVPGKAAGKAVMFQCIDMLNCAKSTVPTYTFPP